MNRVWVLALAVAGCSSLSHEVDRELLRAISIENKLILFEAENDVSIAYDEEERLQGQLRDLREERTELAVLAREAKTDEDRAKAKKDARAAEAARLSQGVLALKRQFLDASADVVRERLAAQTALVLVSLAKYELAKAKLVKKNNVQGAGDLELEEFERQVDDRVARARAAHADVEAAVKEAQARRQAWLAARAQLVKVSGGGAGSPWADEAAAWGGP